MVWSVLQELPEELVDGIFFPLLYPGVSSVISGLHPRSQKPGGIAAGCAERLSRACWFCLSPAQWFCFRVGQKVRFTFHRKAYQFYFLVSNVIKIYYETIIL